MIVRGEFQNNSTSNRAGAPIKIGHEKPLRFCHKAKDLYCENWWKGEDEVWEIWQLVASYRRLIQKNIVKPFLFSCLQ